MARQEKTVVLERFLANSVAISSKLLCLRCKTESVKDAPFNSMQGLAIPVKFSQKTQSMPLS